MLQGIQQQQGQPLGDPSPIVLHLLQRLRSSLLSLQIPLDHLVHI